MSCFVHDSAAKSLTSESLQQVSCSSLMRFYEEGKKKATTRHTMQEARF